jgi:hypothetical protein
MRRPHDRHPDATHGPGNGLPGETAAPPHPTDQARARAKAWLQRLLAEGETADVPAPERTTAEGTADR